jgi:hypothetical protein
MNKWEARSRLRYGSEHQGWFGSLRAAQDFADAEIKRNGSIGRIEAVNRGTRTVYYDVYEELT